MTQETPLQRRLIAERVRSLALVYLTRRADLDIAEQRADIGFDLLVTELADDKPGVRQFGVELRGAWRKVTAEHANKVLRPAMQQLLRYSPFPYPVVVFFFTMENSQGWYTWSAEPVVSKQGCDLLHHGDASCRSLDERAVDQIVDSIDHWYDRKYSSYQSGRRPSPRKPR